jgi:hypothetical protein
LQESKPLSPEKPRWQEDLISKEIKYSHKPIKELLRKTLLDFPAKESGIKVLVHLSQFRTNS